MADIESALISELAANNTAPSPDGLPAGSSPNIVYTQGREALAMAKRAWNRLGPTVTSGGSANAQTISYTSNPTALVRGQGYCFIAGFTNTGPMTLTVGALAATAVTIDGFTLQGGEVRAGLIVEVFYDGTNFQITSGRAVASIASALGGSMRNFLFNPLFNVQQRGAQGALSQVILASTNPYTLDRWYVTTGANEQLTVVATALFGDPRGPFVVSVVRQAGQTGVASITFAQALDTDIIQLLAGQQVTVAVNLAAAAGFTPNGGIVALTLYSGTGSPTRTVTGFTGLNIVAQISQTVIPGGGSVIPSATGTVPGNTRQLEFRLTWTPLGTAPANDTLNIAVPRLNLGPVDLGPDLTRIYTTELPICQRFFQKSFLAGSAPATGVAAGAPALFLPTGASGNAAITLPYAPTLRAFPTVTTYNPVSANANWRDLTNSADRVASTGGSSTSLILIAAATVAGSNNQIHWTADAEIM